MDVVPISMNAANGPSAADAASAQTAKSSGLPAFAQVLADKQSSADVPKPNPSSDSTTAPNSANSGAAPLSTAQSSTAAQPSSQSQTQPAATVQSSAAAAPGKTDPKAKPAAGSQAMQAAASVAAIGATAAMLGLLPVVNPAAIQLPQNDPKSAASPTDAPAAQDFSAAPMPRATATGNAAPPPSALPQPQSAPGDALSASSPTALPDPPLPHLSAELPTPLPPATNSVPPAATSNSPAANHSATTAVPQPTLASSPGPQTLSSQPAPADPQTTATMTAAAPSIAANNASDPAKTQVASSGNHKSSVTDLLRNLASAAGKTVETVAHVTATAARDVAGVLKEKVSPPAAAQPSTTLATAAPKAQTSVNTKPESATAASAQISGKTTPGKNTGNSGDAADNNDAPDAKGEPVADTTATSKTKGLPAEAAAPQPAQPAQAAVANPASLPAAGLSAIASAKEPSVSPKPAVTAQENNPSTASDPDDVKLPVLDSKVVNVSQLTGNDARSEVRIAMQADQLGQVELHATLNGQQVGAAITVEKKEAHAAMAVELPSLQQALEEKNLRVSEVVLSQSTMHSTSSDAGRGGNAPAEQRQNPIGRQYQLSAGENSYPAAPAAILDTAAIFDGYGRLSVRV